LAYIMFKILYICSLACITFVFTYGSQCYEEYKQCPYRTESEQNCTVYNIQSQDQCQTFVIINKNGRNFLFYLKPLTNGQLSISLHKQMSETSTTEIHCDLFNHTLHDSNKWYKINIRITPVTQMNSYNQYTPSNPFNHYTNSNSEYNGRKYYISMELNDILTD
ncbi:unnamed protein product, partial [Meganyctiphanes norvegica]